MTERLDDGTLVVQRDRAMDRLFADGLRLEGLNPDRLVIQSAWIEKPSGDDDRPTRHYCVRVRFPDLYVWTQNRAQKMMLTVEHSELAASPYGRDQRGRVLLVMGDPELERFVGNRLSTDPGVQRVIRSRKMGWIKETLPQAHAQWTMPKPWGLHREWSSGYPLPAYEVGQPA